MLISRLDPAIEAGDFCGVVQVARAGQTLYARAAGLADRRHETPNVLDTRFAIASGAKGLTALAVMSLVAEGVLDLDATAAHLLGDLGQLVDREVTVRQLLAHTSGVGDYLDESAIADIEDYFLDVPVRELTRPADFVSLLGGRPQQCRPGTRFAYCNSGYVLLALLIEAVSGRSYYDIVHERVCAPAQMHSTAFLRLDELPASAAIGYLPQRGWSDNALHVPVRGGGDGGAYTTAGDLARFWDALFEGRIVPLSTLREMLRSQHDFAEGSRRYGLGFWLGAKDDRVMLEGSDAGISFRSSFEPTTRLLYSVLSNTTRGAWPLVKELESLVGTPQLFDQ